MIILTDTREKEGSWNFSMYGYDQLVSTIKTGDYTLRGYEDRFTVERKKTTGELAINIGKKWKTFSKELVRMNTMKAYIICEFSMGDIYKFPNGSGIPREKWKYLNISPQFFSKRIEEIISEFNIPIIFAGDKINAERKFIELANEFISSTTG